MEFDNSILWKFLWNRRWGTTPGVFQPERTRHGQRIGVKWSSSKTWFGKRNESRIPLAIFSPPIFFPPEFLAIILSSKRTWTRATGLAEYFERGAKRACDWQRSPLAMYESGEKGNKVVTMRLTVDKKQFAARVAVEGTIEDSRWRWMLERIVAKNCRVNIYRFGKWKLFRKIVRGVCTG